MINRIILPDRKQVGVLCCDLCGKKKPVKFLTETEYFHIGEEILDGWYCYQQAPLFCSAMGPPAHICPDCKDTFIDKGFPKKE